jgi:hypothetical protein
MNKVLKVKRRNRRIKIRRKIERDVSFTLRREGKLERDRIGRIINHSPSLKIKRFSILS